MSEAFSRDTTLPLDVLAVGAHPDDVEIGCGGTIARLSRAGHRVGIVHLTRGELGTRGSAEIRTEEALRAGEILGARPVEFLDCKDAALRTGDEEESALIDTIRRLRPTIVLLPPATDRHPDHRRAHALARDACFYAGLAKRSPSSLPAHRPSLWLAYMLHDAFAPSLLVDVSDVWEIRERALDAYASQLHPADSSRETPLSPARHSTLISSSRFRSAIAARAQHHGLMIGADRAEAFWSEGPIRVDDLVTLAPSARSSAGREAP